MQRVIRRTVLAKNQAKRKATILEKNKRREDVKTLIQHQTQGQNARNKREKNARLNRREDWLRGPLAPKRDSGLEEGYYGSLDSADVQFAVIPEHLRRRYINIAKGDRVCLLKGPDQGKICEVSAVDLTTETIQLRNNNLAHVYIPDWAKKASQVENNFTTMELSLPIDDVRLVVTLEEDGVPYEAIAEHVYGGAPFLEQTNEDTPKHTRYIAGEDIPIPWPREHVVDNKFKDTEADSLRREVEHETWEPTLKYAPFESSIMDELRNKYSKYRKRHDPEWVSEKEMEDLQQEYLQSRTLLTPQGELKLHRAAQKAEARKAKLDKHGNYIMSQETTSFIANFINGNSETRSAMDLARRKALKQVIG
ncbi:hypothetical protein BGW36DRAFT_378115 [Talaromyces proteolyticus]|uniref:KOW domain-containing protein n=1 Tax=Talaromyces proteolyticus TaxID=1131652 RepID=A0AAD4PVV4_9EURO|nr:uncharacterized protein BGW36DRAFT_378115 [Talaromyces proteolyticus]KAH8697170.1 hypothetical protein BGW36DRAFT_378115 [Talaromyces proteolyticus]